MAGNLCDLCQGVPCGGVAVVRDHRPRHLPVGGGKVLWTCWRRIGPMVPSSPQALAAWSQWVEGHRHPRGAV